MRNILICLALAGCAPNLAGGNAAGGVINYADAGNEAKTFKLAEAECAKYGKLARMTGSEWVMSTARYECVDK